MHKDRFYESSCFMAGNVYIHTKYNIKTGKQTLEQLDFLCRWFSPWLHEQDKFPQQYIMDTVANNKINLD